MEGLTIHGLSKVFTGKLWEKVYWLLILLGVLGFVAYKVHNFHGKYKSNEFRTEIRMVDGDRYTYPEMKVCSVHLNSMSRYGKAPYCYKNKSTPQWNTCYGNYFSVYPGTNISTRDYNQPVSCIRINTSKVQNSKDKEFGIVVKLIGIKIDDSDAFLDGGGYYVDIEGSDLQFKTFKKKPFYYKYGYYVIKIEGVKIINRLPSPYKSNCSNGEDINVFPGIYTREKCADTILFKDLLRFCSDVPDHWKKYVKSYYEVGWDFDGYNRTDHNILACMSKRLSRYDENALKYHEDAIDLKTCPLPCKEITFESTIDEVTLYEPFILKRRGLRSIFDISFKSRRVTEITEVPVYTSDNFFSDVGSWLGLLVGMSFLSVVELLTFMIAAISEKLC